MKRWLAPVGLVLVLSTAGACSGGSDHTAAPGSPSTTVLGAVESTTTTVTSVVMPAPPPAIDVGDPASARAPVSGSVVSPAPSLAELCAPAYVKKTTAPPSVTDPIKARQLAHGPYPDKDPSHYIEDQLIPVELGGAPTDERNLWPQRTDLWGLKNRQENHLRASVCGGHTTLAAAQAEMVQNWGPLPKG
jgi:hypothetical protein